MKWDSTQLSCVCSNPNAVLFTVADVVSCKICGSTINSLSSRNSATACDCPDGLTWSDNIGCACPVDTVLIPGAKPKCVTCDADNLASAVSADGKSCTCLSDALKWFPKTGKCLCPKATQVPVGDPIVCFECKNATSHTTLPVIGGTNCSCTNKKLTWDATTQACACPDPATSVFVSAPSANCVVCDAAINATGVDAANPGKCICETGLTFIDGKCNCGKTSAYIGETGAAICINCINATAYLKNKKNDSECNCLSTALKWNSTSGICSCPENKIPYGKAPGLKCAACKGDNIVTDTLNETDANICQCATTLFNFTISAAGVPSCKCIDKNTIVTLAQDCLVCPAVIADGGLGVILAAHECKCTNTFYFKYADNTCAKCSADLNAKATGGNAVACVCKTTYIWDVITQSCIEPCAANDATCLACADITNSDGGSAVLTGSQPVSTRKAVAGADAIKALLTNSTIPTNFNKLSKYQCLCAATFLWDPVHFKCVSETIN